MNKTPKMKDKVKQIKERYFIETYNDVYALEQIIKKEETITLFQAVVKQASDIKIITWTLISLDIGFKREPLGSGITMFYIDKSVPYFLQKR
ncbi:MAG: hypothetical protein DRI95_14315 [Bacteroidetes bacterium]|nr:MAG: hypothetical protein DRI95_14315 [Bacteroidota bacterium]